MKKTAINLFRVLAFGVTSFFTTLFISTFRFMSTHQYFAHRHRFWGEQMPDKLDLQIAASYFANTCFAALISVLVLLFWSKHSNFIKRSIYTIPFIFIAYIITQKYDNWILNLIIVNPVFYFAYNSLIKHKWESLAIKYIYKKLKWLFAGQYINNIGIRRICTLLGVISMLGYLCTLNILDIIDEPVILLAPLSYFIPFIAYILGHKTYIWIKDGFNQSPQ